MNMKNLKTNSLKMKKPLCENQHLGYVKEGDNGNLIYSKWPEKKKFIYRIWYKPTKHYITIVDLNDEVLTKWTNKKRLVRDYRMYFNQNGWQNFHEVHKFQVTEQRIK